MVENPPNCGITDGHQFWRQTNKGIATSHHCFQVLPHHWQQWTQISDLMLQEVEGSELLHNYQGA
ncbi:hypothetical protein DO97_09520 [Neosynechococcus sphagnicola sy1]|uniref:Uncharacterized protein n=1 Tax=Neosynechococcus sphagnicola sy1 TaxID=1497020 RepID=A0A098TIC6_9CYAN|nr:hypothetical protein [Neosynechococcus sphagnicola]KGF72330.1 hypothetical protein DO97_09520 [Neosynechococcus sphagnicola sy1]